MNTEHQTLPACNKMATSKEKDVEHPKGNLQSTAGRGTPTVDFLRWGLVTGSRLVAERLKPIWLVAGGTNLQHLSPHN